MMTDHGSFVCFDNRFLSWIRPAHIQISGSTALPNDRRKTHSSSFWTAVCDTWTISWQMIISNSVAKGNTGLNLVFLKNAVWIFPFNTLFVSESYKHTDHFEWFGTSHFKFIKLSAHWRVLTKESKGLWKWRFSDKAAATGEVKGDSKSPKSVIRSKTSLQDIELNQHFWWSIFFHKMHLYVDYA